ncbi:MAG: 2-C-methyl-D-erythritol 2,4-cyclodiphosphate synthase [Candidatus Omnitrophica bacterium]|nr:2-C-methyl-D-erythritol 2,4-cyclodiphosphate synthase [Candidatus Omnitrophota bacterium]
MKDAIYRSGIGYDIHRLVKGRKLFLGGIQIAYIKGLSGHSDADVLLHSICDALLGAAGLEDIGKHFPNSDAKYKGIRSTELLKKTSRLIQAKGFVVVNLDATVVAEAPKIALVRLKMQNNIAKILKLSPSLVNLKATTAEGLGDIGKNKAIAAWSVALLRRGKK